MAETQFPLRRRQDTQVTAIVDGATVSWLNTYDGKNAGAEVMATVESQLQSWQNTYEGSRSDSIFDVKATVDGEVVSWQDTAPTNTESFVPTMTEDLPSGKSTTTLLTLTLASSSAYQTAEPAPSTTLSDPVPTTHPVIRSTQTSDRGSTTFMILPQSTFSTHISSTSSITTPVSSQAEMGLAMGGALMTTPPALSNSPEPTSDRSMTITIANSYGIPVSISYGSDINAPTLTALPGTIGTSTSTAVVAPYGWAGRFYLGAVCNAPPLLLFIPSLPCQG